MDAKAIGIFLLKLRKERSLTQRDIAKLCNVSAQAVSKWERGESVPDIELLDRLSMLYALTINEIINGEKKETYIDVNKRANIIGVTVSILVFISYMFSFAEIRVYHSSITYTEYILRGYEVVFNGTSGVQVYVTWFVFVVLLSQLILNIFTATKVINRNLNLKRYLLGSSIGMALVSIFSMFNEFFYPFPQFIIFVCSVVSIFIILTNQSENSLLYKLSAFKQSLKKGTALKQYLMKEDSSKKLYYRLSKVMIDISIVLILFETFIFSVNLFENYEYNVSNVYYYPPAILVLVISLIILVKAIKYVNSIYAKQLLPYVSIVMLVLPITVIVNANLQNSIYPIDYVLSLIGMIPPLYLLFIVVKLHRNK
jgi:transcriptional regulator with XRE-family HTH domain